MSFVKIYGTILRSSIWLEDAETRVLWISMLAMADAKGYVTASVGGLAHTANISKDACEAALVRLSSPDPDSKSKRFEGRRVKPVRGGWLILNYSAYRELRTDEQIKSAERVRRHRERKRSVTGNVTPSDVTGEGEGEVEVQKGEKAPAPVGKQNGRTAVRLDALAVGELVNTIKALAVTPPQGATYIALKAVEALGPEVARAFKAVGGGKRFLTSEGKDHSFLVREMTQALKSASRDALKAAGA